MIEENIVISGDASEGVAAMQKMDQASSGFFDHLESRASHRFEHIGLNIIISQLFALEGAGGHGSAGLRIVEAGIFALFSTIGLVSGPMALLIGAGAALAAAFSSSGNAAEQEKQKIEGLRQSLISFYEEQEQVSAAGRRMAGVMMNEVQTQIAETTSKIAEQNAKINSTQAQLDQYTQTWKNLGYNQDQIAKATADFWSKQETGNRNAREAIITYQSQLEELQTKLSGYKELAEGVSTATKQASINTREQQLKDFDAEAAASEKWAAEVEKNSNQYFDNLVKKENEAYMQQEQMYRHILDSGKSAFTSLGGAFNSSVAQMIVEGKSFDNTFTKAMTHVKEMFIEAIEQMIEKWLIFQALTGLGAAIGGPLGGALASFAGANPNKVPAIGGAQATGGDYTVDQPTMFMAGEAGPEQVTFNPSGGSYGGGGGFGGVGSGVNIGSIAVNVQIAGVQDPQQIARTIAPYIIQEIKGRAQLSFTGPSALG